MKGQEKALELVMVLFVLIVTVYIIITFFQTSLGHQINKLTTIQTEEELSRQAQDMINYCDSLCAKYQKTRSKRDLYEFCTSFKSLDLNRNGELDFAQKSDIKEITLGALGTCEDRIPCFLITDCNMGSTKVDANTCKDIICDELDDLNISSSLVDERLDELLSPGDCYKPTQTFHWYNVYFKSSHLTCHG